MANDPDNETVVTIDADEKVSATISDRPWVQNFLHPQFLDLAAMLKAVLASYSDIARARSYHGVKIRLHEGDHDLATVPVLIACLAELPVLDTRRAADLIVPIVRASLPDLRLDVVKVVEGTANPSDSLELIEALHVQAASTNSRTIADVADALLYTEAVTKQNELALPRLVERAHEEKQIVRLHRNSIKAAVYNLADARLRVLRLAAGAPASQVLSTAKTGRTTLPMELATLAASAALSYEDLIDLQVASLRASLIETQPSLALRWQDTEANEVKSTATSAEDRDALWNDGGDREIEILDRYTNGAQIELDRLHRDVTELHALMNDSIQPDTGSDNDREADTDLSGCEASTVRSVSGSAVLNLRQSASCKPSAIPKFPTSQPSSEPVPSSEDPDTVVVLPTLNDQQGSDFRARTAAIRKQLLGRPLPLTATPDLSRVRADLITMLPHLGTVIDRVLTAMAPHKHVTLPPFLFVGPPGCGKTTLAEELAKALGGATMTIDVAGGADANFLGVDARWHTGAAGVHLDLIMRSQIANPILILDELEKLGGSEKNGDARNRLLGILEPRRAQTFLDPFLNVPTNLSRLNWLFTANTTTGIPPALQNRLEIIRCPPPGREHMAVLATQLMRAEYAYRGLHAAWGAPLAANELEQLRRHWAGGSIRNLRRLVKVVVDSRERSMVLQ